MTRSRLALIVIGLVLISLSMVGAAVPPPAGPQPGPAVPVCNGKYKDRGKPSDAELKEILKQHAAWVKDPNNPKLANDPRRANLCGADLSNARLATANLSGADLSGAHLSGADLLRLSLARWSL